MISLIINTITGILAGFIVSVPPMGPIAFAIISKGFKNEVREGKIIALGAAFMDFFYCLLAFGGINLIINLFPSAVSDFYAENASMIEIVLTFSGCAVVIIYGVKIMRSKITYNRLDEEKEEKYNTAIARANKLSEKTKNIAKRFRAPEIDKSNAIGLFFMGVMLCLSSLTLPASWIALVGYLKGFNFLDSSFPGGLLFSIGAFCGTFIWFYILLELICGNKKRINQATVNKLNIIAGIILLILGAFLFVKAGVSVISVL